MGTFEKHLAAIQAGEIAKSNIIGIRKAMNAYERKASRYSNGRTSPDWTGLQVTEIEHAIERHKPRIVGELHDSGLKLLQSPRYAKRLEEVAAGLSRIDHFTLARFDYLNDLHRVPVYHVWVKVPPVTRKDSFPPGVLYHAFTFRNIPWQTAFCMGLESGPTIESEHG